MKNKILVFVILALFLMQLSSIVLAEEDEDDDQDDPEIFGLEIDELLNLGSGLLATGLFVVTFLAYKKTKRKRLVYVSTAFALFAINGFLTSTELFFEELAWIDPIASFLNFAILLSFFFGIVRK